MPAEDGRTPDDGPGHWRHWREDFDLLSAMGCNAYRLGVDWGRLQPAPFAPLNEEPLAQYIAMLDDLRRRGIEPIVTLHHFANPPWLAEAGYWLNPNAVPWFTDFARRFVTAAGERVRWWITVNEPTVYCLVSYVLPHFAPHGRYAFVRCTRALGMLERAHAAAYDVIKAARPEAMVGIAKHFKHVLPLRAWNPIDRFAADVSRRLFNRWGLLKCVRMKGRRVSDFVGVNYYGRLRMRGTTGIAPVLGTTQDEMARRGMYCDDMWEQDPAYLRALLVETASITGLPLLVSENGCATEDDALRTELLTEHVSAVEQSLRDGVDVRGYLYWSLLDNFEWHLGYTKRFGLVAVDVNAPGRPRRIRPAGEEYARIIARSRGIATPPAT